MSDFNAKMHPIRFRLGLRPKPRWAAYSAPQTPKLDLRGPTSKGRGERGGEGKGPISKGREGMGKKWGLFLRAGRGVEGRRGEGRTWTPLPDDPNPATPLTVFVTMTTSSLLGAEKILLQSLQCDEHLRM